MIEPVVVESASSSWPLIAISLGIVSLLLLLTFCIVVFVAKRHNKSGGRLATTPRESQPFIPSAIVTPPVTEVKRAYNA